MKIIDHKFVEFIPEQKEMEDGVVYVSLEYDTAIHNCMCGCGEQVVTPLSPTDWKLTYNGESISLYPSIGNWEYDCRSHYWIKKGKVLWAEDWSKERVDANRSIDRKIKQRTFIEQPNSNKQKKRKWLIWIRGLFQND